MREVEAQTRYCLKCGRLLGYSCTCPGRAPKVKIERVRKGYKKNPVPKTEKEYKFYSFGLTLEEHRRAIIEEALDCHHLNQSSTAVALGISLRGLGVILRGK